MSHWLCIHVRLIIEFSLTIQECGTLFKALFTTTPLPSLLDLKLQWGPSLAIFVWVFCFPFGRFFELETYIYHLHSFAFSPAAQTSLITNVCSEERMKAMNWVFDQDGNYKGLGFLDEGHKWLIWIRFIQFWFFFLMVVLICVWLTSIWLPCFNFVVSNKWPRLIKDHFLPIFKSSNNFSILINMCEEEHG